MLTTSDALPLVNWSVAVALHETLLAASAAGLVAAGLVRRPRSLDRLWTATLLAGILTASLQVVCGISLFTLHAPAQMGRLQDAVDRTVILGGAHLSVSAVATTRHLEQPPQPAWPTIALLLWSTGAAVRLTTSLRAHRRFVSSLGDRQRVVDAELVRTTSSLSRLAGLAAPPVLMSSDRVRVPVVLSSREVCLPAAIIELLDLVELRVLLAHEIAHIGRRDQQWLRLANVMCRLFWFVPVYPFVERRRRESAELACDDWAAMHAGGAHLMARCLVRVATWTSVPQGGVGPALTGSSPLRHRVERLLEREPTSKRRIWPAVLALSLMLLAALTPRVARGDSQAPPHTGRVYRMEQERIILLRPPSTPSRPRR